MKSTYLLGVAIAGAALAEPHGHQHLNRRHQHQHQKRDRVIVYKSVIEQACRLAGAGGTVLRSLAYADCHAGLENGTYKALGGGQFPVRGITTLVTSTIKDEPTPAPVMDVPPQRPVIATPKPAVSPSPVAAAAEPPPPPPIRAASSGQGLSTSKSTYPKLYEPFPSGTQPCTEFPDEYAVRVPWQGLNGWASVQRFEGDGTGLLDGLANQVNTNCLPNSYCSYHCPDGMLKAQWPVNHQGAQGQSVGGLLCGSDGKLHLSRPEVSRLCIEGSPKATALIENNLDGVVSICRTNYPGDEGETMWQEILPGETKPLAIVDQATYFRTRENKGTSGQYYLNPKGYNATTACRWGDSSVAVGNWAPAVIGLSWSDTIDMGYFGMSNNAPTQKTALLGYTVTIDDGRQQGREQLCRYKGDQITYNGVSHPMKSEMTDGCTVDVHPGNTITFRLTPD